MKIHVKNYKRIKDAEIEIEGLTVLLGPNDHGKTSFLQAIEAALYSEIGNDFIKVGQQYAEVNIKYERHGKQIDWTWSQGKSAKIIFNGEPIAKFNRSVPMEYLKQIGFVEIDLDGPEPVRPNFQCQLEPLFGLKEKSTKLFTMLLSFSQYENFPKVRRNVDKDINDEKRSLSILEATRNNTQDQIEKYTELSEKLNTKQVTEFIDIINNLENSKAVVDLLAKRDKLVNTGQRIYDFAKNTKALMQTHLVDIKESEKFFKILNLMGKRGGLKRKEYEIKLLDEKLKAFSKLFDTLNKQWTDLIKTEKVLNSHAVIIAESKIVQRELKIKKGELKKVESQIASIDVCTSCGAPIKDGVYSGGK